MFNTGKRGSGSGPSLKPRHKSKGFLPLPATFNINSIRSFQRKNSTTIIITILLIWFIFNPLHLLNNIFKSNNYKDYPKPHPLTSIHSIETDSKYIYPPIEHAPLLKELTVHKLIKESRVRDSNFPEIEKNVITSLNSFDDPDPLIQKQKEDEENAISNLSVAKNAFKNHDKVIYKPSKNQNYPEIIVVSAVDFEKYTLDGLTKIVQNRVDYAHQQGYGVYIRWYQEFLPILNSLSFLQLKEKKKWVRIYCMRAAMHAFPESKWFWYLDEDGLIMDMNIDLDDYILASDSLRPVMQREQPIIPPNGAIKTYKNARPENIRLIITQSDAKVETESYIIKNDSVGRSIIEIWGNPLYLNYPSFPFGPDSALTHILQWHPFILSKTAIIPARNIASIHNTGNIGDASTDKLHYFDGDFAATWSSCESPARCEKILDTYDTKLKASIKKQ
ncbi:galactosyl transferase GMA12/MNN10 family-domain-containing protein [Scheffersomyces amazonensis]|uniref:galactosyl transferase GMA12/MNN10 family-domain-containing protein n=1 Tax=Scheffersomyces amazonensis TaxID=1078765 RepID=UPI00315D6054